MSSSTTPPTSEPPAPFSPAQRLLIALALLAGGALRLYLNNHPFASSDHAEVAAIVSFFYPRDLASLGLSSGSTWNLLTSSHGPLQTLIALAWSTLVGVLGITLSELWWNLPFVIIQLLAIPLSAVLARRLAGGWAGAIAALLFALLPILASLSRSSGLSHIPLTSACQLLTILAFLRYYEDPIPRRARQAGLALALNLLVELFFPLLFVLVLIAGMLAVETRERRLGQRLARARRLLFTPATMGLPLAILCFHFALLLLHVNGVTSKGGIAARLLSGSDRRPGIYLGDFWNNATYVVGTPALLLLLALALPMLPALRRLERRALPLAWGLLYLGPFLTFTRPHVYEYFLLGIAPLTLNAAIVLAGWLRAAVPARLLGGLALAALLVCYSARAISMIFGLDLLPLAGTGGAPGGVRADQGLKAAAGWIRQRSQPGDLVFADSAFENYQIFYYLHRPFLAVTDAKEPEEAYRLLDRSETAPRFYLVLPQNEPLLARHLPQPPPLLASVVDRGTPILRIYGTLPEQAQPELIEVEAGNQRFDQQFGSWRAMFAIGTSQ